MRCRLSGEERHGPVSECKKPIGSSKDREVFYCCYLLVNALRPVESAATWMFLLKCSLQFSRTDSGRQWLFRIYLSTPQTPLFGGLSSNGSGGRLPASPSPPSLASRAPPPSPLSFSRLVLALLYRHALTCSVTGQQVTTPRHEKSRVAASHCVFQSYSFPRLCYPAVRKNRDSLPPRS